ncbi:MAG: adenosylhomocysteine nucleosidase [Pseudomonadota bacterium]|nr:adenosylhomocysteine nucleosidase [Pseudomonadota bacterium]
MTPAILSALPEEQSGLVESLGQARHVRHAGRSFWVGMLHGMPVVLALSGMGKVAAATTATVLVEQFSAARIVFTGVAGGVGDGVRVGDVVVAQDYVQHDMDVTPLFERWLVPGYPGVRLPCDAALSALLAQAVQHCLGSEGQRLYRHADGHAPRLHQGLIASGDQFITSAKVSQALRAPLLAAGHDVLAVEMEGAAVAQVCLDYGVPFAAVRTISDRADDAAHVDFPAFIQNVASRYADHMVRHLLDLLSK